MVPPKWKLPGQNTKRVSRIRFILHPLAAERSGACMAELDSRRARR